MSLEVRTLDPHDDATFWAWHDVYLRAERHDLGEVATPWQLEEVRAMIRLHAPGRAVQHAGADHCVTTAPMGTTSPAVSATGVAVVGSDENPDERSW